MSPSAALGEKNLQCVIEEENRYISLTTTALNTEIGSVVCSTSPFMATTLLWVLVLSWLFEAVTRATNLKNQ